MAIHPHTFKKAMSRFASGVTVVTTQYRGEKHGMTASSFCSVSLDPPLVLVCIAKHVRSHEFIKKSGVFAVNILGADQLDWGMRFAGLKPEIKDRFNGINYTSAVTCSPILPGTLGWVDCEVHQAYAGGDHTIFVGEVVAGDVSEKSQPLLYYNRVWRELAYLEELVMG
jgi:flavin reductase (DIM6/NTAB) family NADH-FMN oxidoreductase RutF